MNSEQFWLRIWQTVAIAFVLVVALGAGCTSHANYRIAEAIKDGADPMVVSCAFSTMTESSSCNILGAVSVMKR